MDIYTEFLINSQDIHYVENASMKVILNNTRTAFLNVHKPDEKYNRWGSTFIIDPKSDNAKALDAAVLAVATEKWGAKAPGMLKKMYEDGNVCYHKKEKTDAAGIVYEGFEGAYSISASQGADKPKPTVLDRNKTPLTAADGKPYSGCYVNAHIDLWAQDNGYGKKINASLAGIQFYAAGDAFSGGTVASVDDFEDLGEGADADEVL